MLRFRLIACGIFGLFAAVFPARAQLAMENGFLLPPDKPGSLVLWGTDPYLHKTYARHITAERWVREFVPGKGTKEYFSIESKQNHYLDATHYATAAASILGIKVIQDVPKPRKVSFSEMQQKKKENRG
jgi:hypothetical protein